MNYQRHYEKLIEKARNRLLDGVVEIHHVVPRCLGGSDEKSNLVQLTPEEHFVAHQLLHKIHPGVKGLAFALVSMTGNRWGQRSNKLYGWIRKKAAFAQSELSRAMWDNPEYRAKHKASMDALRADPEYRRKTREAVMKATVGRVKSPEEIAKFVKSKTGMKYKKMSAESRANMAAARRKTWEERRANGTDKLIAAKTVATRRANGSYVFSEEHKAAIGLASKGRITSDLTKQKLSAAMKAYRASLH